MGNPYSTQVVEPLRGSPVTSNDTPYTSCLADLASARGSNLPIIAVGEVSDKTGQINYQENGHALSQGATEMVISAFHKSGKVRLVERYDLRVLNADLALAKNRLIDRQQVAGNMRSSDFIVLGALTELNYNIVSHGSGFWINGIGGGGRGAVINVALDLRLIDSSTLEVMHVSSLQKQITGYEVEANIFSFFGTRLLEFDAGEVRNEPVQLGVRSVVEMAVYQIMTDYFGLPTASACTSTQDIQSLSSTIKENP